MLKYSERVIGCMFIVKNELWKVLMTLIINMISLVNSSPLSRDGFQ